MCCFRLPKVFPLDDVGMLDELIDFAWSVDMTETFNFVDHHFFYDDVRCPNFCLNSALVIQYFIFDRNTLTTKPTILWKVQVITTKLG